jgi:hypothetical protein
VRSGIIDRNAPFEPAANPKTLSVPEAGRIYFDLGRNASYAAAARGEIPTLKVGSRLRVPVLALERMLETAGSPNYEPWLAGGRPEITPARDATPPQPLGGATRRPIGSPKQAMGPGGGTEGIAAVGDGRAMAPVAGRQVRRGAPQ